MKHVTWLASEDLLLQQLKKDGNTWAEIAARLPRHTKSACEQRHYKRNERPAVTPRPPAPRPASVTVRQAAGREPSCRVMRTALLMVDSEMRARIEAQGLTAGWFGDPPKGRSALDDRLAGRAAPAARPSTVRPPAPITLATSPLKV